MEGMYERIINSAYTPMARWFFFCNHFYSGNVYRSMKSIHEQYKKLIEENKESLDRLGAIVVNEQTSTQDNIWWEVELSHDPYYPEYGPTMQEAHGTKAHFMYY
jgi:hypothetical protein